MYMYLNIISIKKYDYTTVNTRVNLWPGISWELSSILSVTEYPARKCAIDNYDVDQ